MTAPGQINGKWTLNMTEDRVRFHELRPAWEAGRLASCVESIRPGMTVYDIGAECGDFTALYGSWVGPEGRVVPFEPKPQMWPSIRAHLEANGQPKPATWWPGFASDATVHGNEPSGFGWPDEDWPAFSVGPIIPDPGFRHLRDHNAPQTRLDDFAAFTGIYPDVVVIDVEGAEWNVLSGAGLLLEDERPPIFYVSVHDIGDESWPGALLGWYGKTLDDIHELMAEHGYEHRELDYHGEGEHFWRYEKA